MSGVKIVLADPDEAYLLPLEHRFVKGFGENADLVVISNKDYFEHYFSTPQQADILVISEELFSRALERHDLANVFILSEEDGTVAGELNAKRIDKYTGAQDIFLEVRSGSVLRHSDTADTNETKVVLFYSPVGGAGTTSLAVGMSEAVARNHKKVLFISAEGLQTFQSFLAGEASLSARQKQLITDRTEGAYQRLKDAICTNGFDYLPPFQCTLSAMNLKMSDYVGIFDLIKSNGEYDYVMVEAPREFSGELSTLMGYADFAVIVAMQDAISVGKLDSLLRNINYTDEARFLFVCGRHRQGKEDRLAGKVKLAAYIPEEAQFPADAEALASLKSIQRLSFMFA